MELAEIDSKIISEKIRLLIYQFQDLESTATMTVLFLNQQNVSHSDQRHHLTSLSKIIQETFLDPVNTAQQKRQTLVRVGK